MDQSIAVAEQLVTVGVLTAVGSGDDFALTDDFRDDWRRRTGNLRDRNRTAYLAQFFEIDPDALSIETTPDGAVLVRKNRQRNRRVVHKSRDRRRRGGVPHAPGLAPGVVGAVGDTARRTGGSVATLFIRLSGLRCGPHRRGVGGDAERRTATAVSGLRRDHLVGGRSPADRQRTDSSRVRGGRSGSVVVRPMA